MINSNQKIKIGLKSQTSVPDQNDYNIKHKIKSKRKPDQKDYNIKPKIKLKRKPDQNDYNVKPKIKLKRKPDQNDYNVKPKIKLKLKHDPKSYQNIDLTKLQIYKTNKNSLKKLFNDKSDVDRVNQLIQDTVIRTNLIVIHAYQSVSK